MPGWQLLSWMGGGSRNWWGERAVGVGKGKWGVVLLKGARLAQFEWNSITKSLYWWRKRPSGGWGVKVTRGEVRDQPWEDRDSESLNGGGRKDRKQRWSCTSGHLIYFYFMNSCLPTEWQNTLFENVDGPCLTCEHSVRVNSYRTTAEALPRPGGPPWRIWNLLLDCWGADREGAGWWTFSLNVPM